MDISIIIVNYKSKGHTLNCIKSIRESDFGNLKYEVIVVDNNSHDSIGKILNWQYPDIIFIQARENKGLGVGNNIGIKKAQGRYIIVMNPDTIALGDVFKRLYEYMESNLDVGLISPQQLNPDKTIQSSCFRFPKISTLIYRRTFLGNFKFARKSIDKYLMKDFDHKKEKEVDWILGSFMFMRAKVLKDFKGFDERFFLYFEDTDLCRRFWKKNWKVVYYPMAKIIHNHARESAQIKWYKFFLSSTGRYHFISWLKYLKKWGIGN